MVVTYEHQDLWTEIKEQTFESGESALESSRSGNSRMLPSKDPCWYPSTIEPRSEEFCKDIETMSDERWGNGTVNSQMFSYLVHLVVRLVKQGYQS